MMDLAVPKIPREMMVAALKDAAQIELDPFRDDFDHALTLVLDKVFKNLGQRAAFFESVSRQWEQAELEDTHAYPAVPGALRLAPQREYQDDLDTIDPTGWDAERGSAREAGRYRVQIGTIGRDRFTVLVVDDSKSYVTTVAKGLRDVGFDVLIAMNGWEALKAFDPNRIDCLLLDVSMPRMDGIELLELIHRRHYERQVPALMITSDATPSVQARATAAGASGVIAKPAPIQTLVTRIKELTSGFDAAAPI